MQSMNKKVLYIDMDNVLVETYARPFSPKLVK